MHLHVIANLVNNKGESISDSWLGARARKISQELTIKHELKQALTKELKLTNLEALSEYEATKYKIYQRIHDCLPECINLELLDEKLLKHGIDTLYKYKGQTPEVQGISFKMGEYSYKGSQIDRKYSFQKLVETLNLHKEQNIKRQLQKEIRNETTLRLSKELRHYLRQ